MKMMRMLKNVKLNNKGMSLVEIIVAVAVFTIVAVPTIAIMASASGTNLDSRLRQRATVVGESVMESFKAYDMEALCKQFRGGTFKGVTDGGATTMSVVAQYGAAEGSPFRPDDELDQDATGYIFRANDVISEGQHYDIKVEVKPIVTGPHIIRMDSINEYSDAIVNFDEAFNTRLVGEMNTKAKENFLAAFPTRSEGDIRNVEFKNFKRTFTITVNDVDNVQQVLVTVSCTCEATVTYQAPTGGGTLDVDFDATDMATDITMPFPESTDYELVAYDNSSTIAGTTVNGKKCKLNQIYFNYYPAYEKIFGEGAEDEIIVDASLSTLYDPSITDEPEAEGYMPLRVNIAKQKYSSISTTELNNEEVNYTVSVDGNIAGGGRAVVFTNYGMNLSGESGVLTEVHPTGFWEASSFMEAAYGEVNLLYSVEVHVYEHAEGDDETKNEVATFVGTKND